jgi:hypothetical protein
MVRRGSTVRVRQRALKSAARRRFLVQIDLLRVDRAVGMEPFMELWRPRGRLQPWPAAQWRARSAGRAAVIDDFGAQFLVPGFVAVDPA